MNRSQFLKKMKGLNGDNRNLFILCCGLFNNSIQSVNDLEKTLNIKFNKEETISMNKYMFRVSMHCKFNNINLYEYLSDEYLKFTINELK